MYIADSRVTRVYLYLNILSAVYVLLYYIVSDHNVTFHSANICLIFMSIWKVVVSPRINNKVG